MLMTIVLITYTTVYFKNDYFTYVYNQLIMIIRVSVYSTQSTDTCILKHRANAVNKIVLKPTSSTSRSSLIN